MKLWSDSFANGEPIPAACARRWRNPHGHIAPGDNRPPHLAWDEVPAGTRSFALIAQDFDALHPSHEAPAPGTAWPEDLPRADQFLWLLVDIPADWRTLAGDDLHPPWRAGGDPGDAAPGYHGPDPAPDDPLVHHCAFTVFALDVERAPVPDHFDGATLRAAIFPHVLAAATLSGTYTLRAERVAALAEDLPAGAR